MKICIRLLQALLFVASSVHAWTTTHRKLATGRWEAPPASTLFARDIDDTTNGGDDGLFMDDQEGPEKSLMFQYISDFLKKQNDDETNHFVSEFEDAISDSCTHLIAIPVDTCHELLLELESVQRGILYHCPILVHSCIVGSMTRLPLLYVQVPPENNAREATAKLKRIVQEAVNRLVITKESSDDTDESDSLNADGIQPLNVQFQSLEIDGGSLSPNEVLYTIAEPGHEGTQTIQNVVKELQDSIRKELGYATILPSDDDRFRPRIPFMRLPDNWEEYLEKQVEQDDNVDETFMLTSDQGGNGISPILWGKWCDDVLGGEQRLREIAIYQRATAVNVKNTGRLSEIDFPLPAASVGLPAGSAAQVKGEAKWAAYQENRMLQAEAALEHDRTAREEDECAAKEENDRVPEDDLLLTKTRERLEKIYTMDNDNDGDDNVSPKATEMSGGKEETWDDVQKELSEPQQRPSDPAIIDKWTRKRIEKAVQSRARVLSEIELAKKKDRPPIEDNTIFARYKEGTLVPEEDRVLPATRELPPFPSPEHCTGFWRMIGSPTGFDVEEGDASRSDNLILRVDGTIAGGPILDQETRQKASGGKWKMILLDGDPDTPALKIRLTLPPKKERILVMEGKLEKLSMTLDMPLAPSTFGIPALEERAANSAAAAHNDELEDMLYCSGSVWIEDAGTKANRDDIGSFSIRKLKTPTDPSQFTITIPKNVRNQD